MYTINRLQETFNIKHEQHYKNEAAVYTQVFTNTTFWSHINPTIIMFIANVQIYKPKCDTRITEHWI